MSVHLESLCSVNKRNVEAATKPTWRRSLPQRDPAFKRLSPAFPTRFVAAAPRVSPATPVIQPERKHAGTSRRGAFAARIDMLVRVDGADSQMPPRTPQ